MFALIFSKVPVLLETCFYFQILLLVFYRCFLFLCKNLQGILVGFCHCSPRGECGLKQCRSRSFFHRPRLLPTRGVRIETKMKPNKNKGEENRSPRGECGLKCKHGRTLHRFVESLPTRGVRIEITPPRVTSSRIRSSLPTRGARIEIYQRPRLPGLPDIAPHRERGLEYLCRSSSGKPSIRSFYKERGLKHSFDCTRGHVARITPFFGECGLKCVVY